MHTQAKNKIAAALATGDVSSLGDCTITEGGKELGLEEVLIELLGLIEVTEWVASCDCDSEGWVQKVYALVSRDAFTS
jgi:hypothetical protein